MLVLSFKPAKVGLILIVRGTGSLRFAMRLFWILFNDRHKCCSPCYLRKHISQIILLHFLDSCEWDLILKVSGDPWMLQSPLCIVSLQARYLANSANKVLSQPKNQWFQYDQTHTLRWMMGKSIFKALFASPYACKRSAYHHTCTRDACHIVNSTVWCRKRTYRFSNHHLKTKFYLAVALISNLFRSHK